MNEGSTHRRGPRGHQKGFSGCFCVKQGILGLSARLMFSFIIFRTRQTFPKNILDSEVECSLSLCSCLESVLLLSVASSVSHILLSNPSKLLRQKSKVILCSGRYTGSSFPCFSSLKSFKTFSSTGFPFTLPSSLRFSSGSCFRKPREQRSCMTRSSKIFLRSNRRLMQHCQRRRSKAMRSHRISTHIQQMIHQRINREWRRKGTNGADMLLWNGCVVAC